MTKPKGEENKLADEHWTFIKKILDQEIKEKEVLYKEAIKHGVKHGIEIERERVKNDKTNEKN